LGTRYSHHLTKFFFEKESIFEKKNIIFEKKVFIFEKIYLKKSIFLFLKKIFF